MSNFNLVLHVDKEDGSLPVALKNAVNYATALQGQPFMMILVANSKAARLFKAEHSEIKDALEKACSMGLSVRVCANAMKDHGITAEELYPQCSVVPAGIVEIVKLQQEGFAYIKP